MTDIAMIEPLTGKRYGGVFLPCPAPGPADRDDRSSNSTATS